MAVKIIALLLIGYICGLFPTGMIIAKCKGVDIRHEGSGNSGATNSLRVMGKKAGLLVLLGDSMKAFLPCMAVRFLFGANGPLAEPDMMLAYVGLIGIGAVLGHDFPFFMKFKGGKGISSTTGFSLALDWRITLIGFVFFVLIVSVTKYVSLASMFDTTMFCIVLITFSLIGMYGLCPLGLAVLHSVGLLQAVLSVWSHRSNVKRLLAGEENRFSLKSKI